MKRIGWIAILAGVFACSVCLAADKPAAKSDVPLKSKDDRISYVIGMRIGADLKEMDLNVQRDALIGAIADVLENREPALSQADFDATFKELMMHLQEVREKKQKEFTESGEKALKEGQEFLAANAKREGVKITPSGLQYEVVKEGSGAQPNPESVVRVHYRGTFIDGGQFDSSYGAPTPSEFPVGKVIRGWTEALQMMKEGAKYKIYVPANLAYGAMGRRSDDPASPDIVPNSVLIFEIELLKVLENK